jgi:transaldolase
MHEHRPASACKTLYNLGQSLWLDHITRGLISSGGLNAYLSDFAVTGLTSNPTIFAKAFKNGDYTTAIAGKRQAGLSDEDIFFALAIEDLSAAAAAFRPIFERTNGVDGWVSLEVSPLLAYDAAKTSAMAQNLFKLAAQPNLFIKIPGTPEGLGAIEEAIFAGVPVNVTLLFSSEQYLAAADAYLRGIERRVAAKLNPHVAAVASVFISRWDVAVSGKVPASLNNKLGLAIAQRTYRAYSELLNSSRWLRLANLGARPQRLLWASTGTKDPQASDLIYVEGLAAALTVNTMPEATLKALADHGKPSALMPHDGGDCESQLASFKLAGINIFDLAMQLQQEGAIAFTKSWTELMHEIHVAGR